MPRDRTPYEKAKTWNRIKRIGSSRPLMDKIEEQRRLPADTVLPDNDFDDFLERYGS
jgi:hypothetical protein